jgi:A/G-specific adenine glycosylase
MNKKKSIKERTISPREVRSFRKVVCGYYTKFGRDLPWRKTLAPYRVLVSELMLQQTQVDRVIGKFEEFVKAFPDLMSLHAASLAQVLAVWRGLGYNRRALALKKIASIVVEQHAGRLPDTVEKLVTLPGIGPATASSICAFAYDKPVVFIETNIRTVFIHHFFKGRPAVDDSEIVPLVERTLDKTSPRIWYSALMDYGTMLKKKFPNPSRKSSNYVKQSPFQGSRRQLRGKVLGILLDSPQCTEMTLRKKLAGGTKGVIREILEELVREGLIVFEKGKYSIA